MFGFEHYVILLMKVFVAYFNWSIIALSIQNITFDFDICYDFITMKAQEFNKMYSIIALNFKEMHTKQFLYWLRNTVNISISRFDKSTVFEINFNMTSHYQEAHVRFWIKILSVYNSSFKFQTSKKIYVLNFISLSNSHDQ